ncbi:MAG: hypothetical protein IKO68_05300 [Oscillospiraceae bacterium]|nr:hypothetical protein [Oscillospiraceae bacterium]
MKKRIISFTICLLLALTLWAPARATSGTEYKSVLEDTLDGIYFTITDPVCDSIGGDWAVLALARGGYTDEAWYGRYLDAVSAKVDSRDGVMHSQKYTEYSRVILGLSSIGQDATKFNTGTKTYDLVSPLLSKQANGEYWATYQGNTGTAFAIIALDSQNYFNNASGKTARAGLLDALLDVQLSSGGWNISSGGADIDTTAMALQALAPYYLSQTKYEALNASHSYAQLQNSVSKALNFLKGKKSNDYGSAEAAAQVVVALAALNRDAANDPLLGDVLSSVLAYYDGEGGFLHLKDGSDGNNQMSTEQACYALVAYDRWKTGKSALYDMTDRPAVSSVKIDATGEATVKQTASGIIRVTCPEACAVIAVMPDGTYMRLSPEGSGNTRTFHTVQSKVIVRLLGDYDGDDSVETLDLAKANKALLGSGVGALEALIMGADNGCELETVDLARLNKKLVNDTKFDW